MIQFWKKKRLFLMFITIVIIKIVLFLELPSCDMIIFFCAWNLTRGFVKRLVSTGLSSVSLWSVWLTERLHCQLAEPFAGSSLQRRSSCSWLNHSWTRPGSTQLMETRQKCSYASCDGLVHCLLCLISLVPYLIPTLISYAPFWINKSWFLKCVALM